MHSPFRSESDVFRAVVLVTIGAGLAVAVGALTDAAVGGIVAAGLLGLALGATLRAGRGSLPVETMFAPRGRGGYRMLVLANQTVEGKELLGEIRDRAAGRDAVELLVVVPALTRSRLESITSDTDSARAEAGERLERSLATLRAAGLDARGSVGDEDPVQAARDALGLFGADEVIVSTHPPSRSPWLERGVVEQLRRELELPLTHVVVHGAEGHRTAAPVAR